MSVTNLQEQQRLVCIVEGDSKQSEALVLALQNNGYPVRVFTQADNLFRSACFSGEPGRPLAVVMSMDCSDDGATALFASDLELCNKAGIPVIATSSSDNLAYRLTAFRSGAKHYLTKPINTSGFINLIDELVEHLESEPYRVLLIDDDQLSLKLYNTILTDHGMEIYSLQDPLKALEVIKAFSPDVVVLDLYMPDVTGSELVAVFRESGFRFPILYLSSVPDTGLQVQALAYGADDFMVKPVQADHFSATVAARAQRSRHSYSVCQKLEKTLYEREREHLALNEHAIVSITDRKGIITYVNDRFCKISGYDKDELLGKKYRIVKSDHHSASFYKRIWITITHGDVWRGEICNRRSDGSLYWVETTITPFLDAKGRPYQYVSIHTDISHTKMADLALKMSESRLSFLVTESPVTIYTCSCTSPYGVEYISPNVQRLLGYKPEDIIDNANFWIENIHPDEHEQIPGSLPRLFERGMIAREYRLRTKQGYFIWMHDELRLIKNNADEPVEIIGYLADISERKRSEKNMELHKRSLHQGQIFANIGTWDWDIQTDELFWSECIAPLLGYSEGGLETSYKNFLNAIHPDDRQLVMDAINNSVVNDAPYEIEHRVLWPDGNIRWLLERGAVVRDSAGNAIKMLSVVQDIDSRKRAELALAESEQQLKEAQTLANIGNWQANIITGELMWSDEIYRIFGYEVGCFVPCVEFFHSVVHPDDRALLIESEKAAEKTGYHDVVHRIILPDDSVRYVHELAQAENDSDGNLIRLTGTVQDITDIKLMQDRLEQQKKLLDMLHKSMSSFVDKGDFRQSMDSMLETLLELTGSEYGFMGEIFYDNDEPYLKTHTITNIAWDKETEALYQKFYDNGMEFRNLESLYGHVMTSGKSMVSNDPASDPRSAGLPKGHPAMNSFLGTPIFYGNEMVAMYAIANREEGYDDDIQDFLLPFDTTYGVMIHSKRIMEMDVHNRQALVVAKETAERANHAKSDFLSSMSHELRTPMNAVLGFSQMLEYDDLTDEQHDSVQEIIKAGRHLMDLINEILDLAKIESGSIALDLKPVNVHSVINECLGLIKSMADKRNVTITFNCSEDITVHADYTRLMQVLLNLLSNAIKYNRDAGSVDVDVIQTENNWVQIRVADTGIGVSRQRKAELFEPFNRLDAEKGSIEGTGIGLTITRRIIEMMGGIVDLESQPDVGSTFWVELPTASIDAKI